MKHYLILVLYSNFSIKVYRNFFYKNKSQKNEDNNKKNHKNRPSVKW